MGRVLLLLLLSAVQVSDSQGIFEQYAAFNPFGAAEPAHANDEALDERDKAQIENAVKSLASQFKRELTEHITEQVRAAKTGESKFGQSKIATSISALQFAAANNQYEKVVKLLSEENADPNVATPSLLTPLHTAAEAGYKDVVDVLLLHNATVDARGPDDMTPLHLAAHKGRASVTELLLREGADTSVLTASRRLTPLYLACEMGHTRVVSRLLGANASVHHAAIDGSTALHVACREGHEGIVDMLIEGGARVDEPDLSGARPIHWAVAGRNTAIAHKLMTAGAVAVSEDNPDDIERIAHAGGPQVKVEVTSKMFTMGA